MFKGNTFLNIYCSVHAILLLWLSFKCQYEKKATSCAAEENSMKARSKETLARNQAIANQSFPSKQGLQIPKQNHANAQYRHLRSQKCPAMCWCELFFLKKIRKGKKKTDLHLTLFF
jgi:hypothetical protein